MLQNLQSLNLLAPKLSVKRRLNSIVEYLMQIVDETLAGLNETLLRPVYTGDFCRAIQCNFLICNLKLPV